MKPQTDYILKTLISVLILAVYLLVLWWEITPAWKRQLMIRRVLQMTQAGKQQTGERLLTVAQELEVLRFRSLVSKWDHEQTATRNHRKEGNQP